MLLQEWLAAAIRHFQQRANAISAEALRRAAQELDLRAPCQVVGFATRNPEWQGFAVMHIEAAANGAVTTYENLEPWEVSKAVEKAFQEPFWDNPLPPTNEPAPRGTTLRDVVFLLFDSLLSSQRSTFYLEPSRNDEPFWGGGHYAGRCSVHQRRGPMLLDPEGYVDAVLRRAEAEAAEAAKHQVEFKGSVAPATPSVERPPEARGVFLRPPLRIGQIRSKQIGHWYRERDHPMPGILVAETTLGPHAMLVTGNGFLALRNVDLDQAVHWLNLAMAGFLVEGFPATVVRRSDLAAVHPPRASDASWGGSYPYQRERHYWPWAAPWVSDDDLARVIQHAERLAKEPLARHIPLFLEAHTHVEANAYTESFVYSWALIEQQMTLRWDAFLESKQVSSKRREKLKGTDWSLHSRCEAMNLAGVLSAPSLQHIDRVRRARNDIMHGDRLAEPEEAKDALGLAEALLIGDGQPLRGKRRQDEGSLMGFL